MAVTSGSPMLASDTELTADDIILADNIKQYRIITVQPNNSIWGNTYGPNCYLVKDSSQVFPLKYEITRGDGFRFWTTTGGSISGNRLTIDADYDSAITVTGVFTGADPILNNNDWATISRFAKAGTAAQYWSVGDYKEVSIAAGIVDEMSVVAGTYRAVIIGINHNPTYENANSIDFCIGQNTSGTEICFFNSTGVRMNASDTTTDGWIGSQMYLTYLPQFYNLLSGNTGLQDAMIAPKKYTHNATGGSGNNTAANVTLSENTAYKMFLMAEFEIYGTRSYANLYEQDKQAQYEYYSSSVEPRSKKRYRTGTGDAGDWWVRSAACSGTGDLFCQVNTNGNLYVNRIYNRPNRTQGLVPCFRVGLPEQKQRVGGVVFFIDDSSSTNTYTFYDANGNQVDAPEIGTDCTDWTYKKTGTGTDKFYVYYPTLITGKYWGYDGIVTGAHGTPSMGTGKTSTETVLAIPDTSDYASGSIWEYIKNMRTNNVNGCDDWFVGCYYEHTLLQMAILFYRDGTPEINWFNSNCVWSSDEEDSESAYIYDSGNKQRSKFNQGVLIPLRAF